MKFAHLADLHIGGWREHKMSVLTIDAFRYAVEDCILEKVDFMILAGDIFNTSLPNIDFIKETAKNLRTLKDKGIPVYVVTGSHDFSPSGKTIIDVFEYAGLLINVVKANKENKERIELSFTVDQKTGAKIVGMVGKKNMLEKAYYEVLDREKLESEKGFKIFVFHSAIDELKPEDMSKMESSPASLLPKGFDYYAGGHVHIVKHVSIPDYNNLVYPGPLFPNSFSEMEKLGHGGYYIYNDGLLKYKDVKLKEVVLIDVACENKSPEQVNEILSNSIKSKNIEDSIVLIKLCGKLKIGKSSEIHLNDISSQLYEKKAYFVMKNTNSLHSPEFEEVKKTFDQHMIEEDVIKEHLGQIKVDGFDKDKEKNLIFSLISSLSKEKNEGETNTTYEERVLKEISLLE
jgi:DNA repair exonuclease SbcCD nuclease subunit